MLYQKINVFDKDFEMIKIAYLILAHNNPSHFKRLMTSLRSDKCMVFVHLDRKSPLEHFVGEYGSSAKFLKTRIPVYRGDHSIVRATLLLIQTALSDPHNFDYLILLSGCDYPLKSNAYIENYLELNRGKEFMNIVEMPNDKAGKPISRLTDYKYSKATPFFLVRFHKFLVRIGLIPKQRDYRKYLKGLVPYAGSQWWCLSRKACEYILDFVDNHPEFIKFFQNTSSNNEILFHTILGNSEFKQNIQRNLMFTDWSENKSHPAIIDERHLEIFNKEAGVLMDDHYGKGEALFARKFTDNSDYITGQIDKVKEEVLQNSVLKPRQTNDE